MKKFKWLALLCVVVLCFTLVFAACDPYEDTPADNDLEFNDDGSVKFPNVTVKLVTVVSGEDTAAFQEIIDDFNAQYRGKITIAMESLGQTGFESTVAQRISSKNKAPDLIMSHQKGHKYFADNKVIQPFSKSIMDQTNIKIDMADYSSGLAQYTSLGYDNELYSIPCDAQSMVVFYNKQLLGEIGKSLPTNHAELLDVCQAFVDKYHTSPIAWPAKNQNNHFYNYVFTSAIIQNGGQLYDPVTKKADWTSSANSVAMTNAIQSIRDLIDSDGQVKYAPYNDKATDDTSQDEFVHNRALFYVYLPWRITSLETLYKRENNVSDVDLPDYIGTTSIANWFAMDASSSDASKIFVDSHFFAMSKTVNNATKQAAILEFVKWFTQRVDVCKKWASTGHITACKVVSSTDEYKNDPDCQRYINNFYPNIDNFVCIGLTSHYDTVLKYVKALALDTLSDPTTDIARKLQSIQKEFNDEVDVNSMF